MLSNAALWRPMGGLAMTRWIVLPLVAGLTLSTLAAWETQRSNERIAQQAVAAALAETADAVTERIHRYQLGLRGLRGAIQVVEGQQLSLAGFQRYSNTRDIHHEFPGARGFGFIRRVLPGQDEAFVQQQRYLGQSDFNIQQFHPHDGERFVVQYIAPIAINRAGLGLDIASEPSREKAAVDAMRSGTAQLTRPISFYQSTNPDAKALLMLLPVYRSAVTPATEQERVSSAIGWTYAPLQVNDVLSNLVVSNTGLGLQLIDVSQDHMAEPLYTSPSTSPNEPVLVSQAVEREIFGRRWRLQMFAYEPFIKSLHQTSPWLVFVIGLLISGLAAALLALFENLRRRRIEIFTDQARLAAIVESSSDGIISKDMEGVVTSWNKGAELIFGFTSDEAVGKRVADLLVPLTLQNEEREILARINRGERVSHFETQRLHRDGRLLDVSVAVAPIHDGTGMIVGASKTVRDISTQKAAKANLQKLYSSLELQVVERTAELQQSKLQADSANAAKSAFLANMSHEIRTPLNAVLGMLQLLLLTPLNMRQSDYVTKAKSASTSLLDLLNDILDFSKIEAGKLQLDAHRFELETLMRGLAVVLSGNQGDKEVEVVFDLSPNLPSVLVGDSLRLQQVLINLAGNALKFTAKGYVIVSITMLEQNDSNCLLRFAVTDTGIGIAQEHQAHIFEGFSQAETSTSRRFGGSGLGLVICKRLVELMGGHLQVVSEPEKGSRFWFDLRCAVEPGKTLKGDCHAADTPLRILIADDNQVVAELLLRTVEALGWQANVVSNGRLAVELVRKAHEQACPYDVVLMDWRMPELDGLSAAQLIHDDTTTTKQPVVVMITAYGREALAQIQQIGQSPFVDFLTKPVTPKQLAFTVQQALAGTSNFATIALQTSQKRLLGLSILVVEDNALNRQVAAELLKHEGARVQLAEGGLQGVSLALNTIPAFDVVIMDIQMPDIDGYEATRRIRADQRGALLPILAMTANASETDRQLCLAAGMNEHVGKPIDINQVVNTVLLITGHQMLHDPAFVAAHDLPVRNKVIEPGASILNRFGMNIDLVKRLFHEFQHDAQSLLADLQRQVEVHDLAAQSLVLHSLKGSAGSIGATALQVRAGELEKQLKALPAESADPLITSQVQQQLQQLLALSVEQLSAWIATCEAPVVAQKSNAQMPALEWQHKREELLELLLAGNMRAIELTEELMAGNPPLWFTEVAAQVYALMFNSAANLLRDGA